MGIREAVVVYREFKKGCAPLKKTFPQEWGIKGVDML